MLYFVFRFLIRNFNYRLNYYRSEIKKKNRFSFCISLAYS